MEAADMLDVLHYLYEEDVLPAWEQHGDLRSKIRVSMYQQLYDREYKYRVSKSAGGDEFDPPEDDAFANTSPANKREVKPYIPPTAPEDLQKVLGGGPMGG